VGECFFWYRPTRVVPDKRPLNGCVCVCVLLHLLYFASLMRLSSKETHIDHVVSNKCDWHVSVSTVCRAVPGIRKKLLRY